MSWTALHPTGSFAGQCGEEDTMEEVVVVGIDLAPNDRFGSETVIRQACGWRATAKRDLIVPKDVSVTCDIGSAEEQPRSW